MASKYQYMAALSEHTAQEITSNPVRWLSFLNTAASVYKYPFNDQLMIYAQRPDTPACAGLKAVNTGGVIGEYAGFTLKAQFDSFLQQYKLSIKGKTTHTIEVGPDPAGNITRINNVVTGLGKNLEKAEQQLQSLHEKVESAKAEIMRPFPQEEELAAKLARLREVNAMLDMDDKGADTVPAQEGDTVAADRANTTPIARVAIPAAAQATCADQPRRASVLDRLKANQAVVAAQVKPSPISSHRKDQTL